MKPDINQTDEELAIATLADKNQFYHLVQRYEKKILRYVRYLIKDEDKAADLAQETFIKAYTNLASFNPKQKWSSWLYRIAHNSTVNEIRKYHSTVNIDLLNPPSSEDIIEDFSQKELTAIINNCLSDIPAIYSEPIILYYLEERSYEDISDILRIPMNTVATRLSRAKQLLKSLCQKKKNR